MATPPHESRRVRCLVVDDSALIRKLLAEILASTGEIEVVATARDGPEGIDLAERLKPDVVTLDVQMPGMSGLEVIPALLASREVPIVMVSTLTQEGAAVTLEALELGAVDYVPKPEKFQFAELRQNSEGLVGKVLAAARGRVQRPRPGASPKLITSNENAAHPTATRSEPTQPTSGPVVVIGISTGGPQTLAEILPAIEPPAPPILIVQHMPPRFTAVFAERLNRHCSLTVKEAAEGDRVLTNQVLVAPGSHHIVLSERAAQVRVTLSDAAAVSGHKPSVDVLFQSAARLFGPRAIGFIMTGMGRDGVDGCKAILAAGGDAYGQNEATSVVYGMNKAAFLEGAVRAQFAPDELPTIIRLMARKGART